MRYSDWINRLLTEIEAASSRAFEWGQHDCCLFAARCVDAITGSTYEADLQAQYTDQASAMTYLESQTDLSTALTVRFGAMEPWWRAMRGDLMLVPTDDGIGSVGICLGPTIACVSTTTGVTYVKNSTATGCWHVL